jgi:hypothetical protein
MYQIIYYRRFISDLIVEVCDEPKVLRTFEQPMDFLKCVVRICPC